jgi:hypothetical protein
MASHMALHSALNYFRCSSLTWSHLEESLQARLDELEVWFIEIRVFFNPGKYKHSLRINGSILPVVEEIKNLGITLNVSKASFDPFSLNFLLSIWPIKSGAEKS